MATTTLRVSEELKERIASLAERAGKTPHAFMLEAIEEVVQRAEARAEFVAEAGRRLDATVETGRALDWREMRTYLKERAAGKKARSPRARSWRK